MPLDRGGIRSPLLLPRSGRRSLACKAAPFSGWTNTTELTEETMKSTKPFSMTLAVAIAGALILGVAGCDRKPKTEAPGKTFDKLVENAGRDLQSAADPAPPPAAGETVSQARPASPSIDAALEARVKAALSAEPNLSSLAVDVKSTDGVVTLYGTADSPRKSHEAALVALNVDGVRSVKNEMVVRGS
jgi:hyperosmotically inducible periplasmic protein